MARVSDNKVREIIEYFRTGKPDKGILADVADMLEELMKYRKEIQTGRMVRIPCAIGDTIYVIPSDANYGLNILHKYQALNRIYPQRVDAIARYNNSSYVLLTCDGLHSVVSELYQETWFLSETAAKKALRKLEVKWNQAYSKHPGGGK